MHKFVQNIVAFSLRNHILVLFMSGLLVVAGVFAYMNTPIEAYPDVTNTRAKPKSASRRCLGCRWLRSSLRTIAE